MLQNGKYPTCCKMERYKSTQLTCYKMERYKSTQFTCCKMKNIKHVAR